MAPSVEKKIAELEMGLLHLQQNIDIPEISLSIHNQVSQASPHYTIQYYVTGSVVCVVIVTYFQMKQSSSILRG